MTESTKVLIVDDHELTRSLLRHMLKDAGYTQIREVADGESCLRIVPHFVPDLICLDMQMPGKSGLETLTELRAADARAVVLMVTASNDRDTIIACMNAGADGYIIKPFNAATIARSIQAGLSKRGGHQ